MRRTGLLLIFVVVAFTSKPARAAPMGFKDSWMVMGDFSSSYRELSLNYALSANDAFGIAVNESSLARATSKSKSVEATYVRKLRRWNFPNAQANIWFLGSLGGESSPLSGERKTSASAGLQADYETTRFYSMVALRTNVVAQHPSDIVTARIGFSFYEVEYEQPQPWIIIEARKMSIASADFEFTPMLRVVHRRYFIEIGASGSGDMRLNFMYNH